MNIKQKNNDKIRYITKAGIIAALYATLTLVFYPISFGAVQCRISEAMCVLPLYFPEAIPGLFVGCIVSNLISPNIPLLDLILGSAATLLSAITVRAMKNYSIPKKCLFAPLPAVVFNAFAVGAVITVSTVSAENSASWELVFLLNCLTVAIGQVIACYIGGIILIYAIEKLLPKIRKKL